MSTTTFPAVGMERAAPSLQISFLERNGDPVSLAWIASPLGPLLAGAAAEGVCRLEFVDTGARQLPVSGDGAPHLAQLQHELAAYFAGELRRFSVPLLCSGTDFQRRVWQALLDIPYGETRSYEDIAIAVGAPRGMRAVGRANGQNRLAIIIPCHRVVNKNGGIGGYGGGLHRKEFLLALERQ